ncbi:MAG TPA: lysylphosphatidylglycerol synthase transmembrane domain-containing protein [Ktedonobacteraceae bacterium]|nr:lysylphosphatidylglycerol synthase transmembrane domain-containing protein [Ktedonobacteraceae bacterium]
MEFDLNIIPPTLRPRPARPRLIGLPDSSDRQQGAQQEQQGCTPVSEVRSNADTPPLHDIARQVTAALPRAGGNNRAIDTPLSQSDSEMADDISKQATNHLMQLSGMMPAIKLARPGASSPGLPADGEEGYWPRGIQQTGALPVVNLYGREPFGRSLPRVPAVMPEAIAAASEKVPAWKAALQSPAVKIAIGLLVGIGLLFLVAHFVDIPSTVRVLRENLTTPRGILLALLSGVAFLMAFSIRGARWKLFLNPIGKVSTFKAIQLFLVGIFLNFLLPIRGGEVAKSLMLKRIANIPVSKSLPTVAMDKALDLMPALFIMAIVPLLGVQMDIKLWVVLALVGGLLVALIFFIALAAWKRNAAIHLLQKLTGMLPKSIASKIEGFATGFVDSLLAGARQPRIFLPALLLTIVAVIFDGLFAWLAFATIGYPIPFGTAIFGYTVYNMFYILPTPPGQVGSNEAVGLLVFTGLLHLPADKVTAMFVFSHPWAAMLMCTTGMACLSALGLKLSSAMKVQTEGENVELPEKPAAMRGVPVKV